MKSLLILPFFLSGVLSHYTFSSLTHNLTHHPHWKYIRRWSTFVPEPGYEDIDDILPMYAATQLSSVDLRCNVNATHTPDVLDVYAGEEVTWHVPYTISHPGPLMGYLARAPEGGVGWEGEGEGDVWFKIYEDFPTWYTETYQNGYIAHSVRWPNLDLSTLPIPLPPTLPPGEYLFRIEHIGLQTATDPTLGAQFFVSCAQIRVLPPINPQTTIQNHGVGGIPGPLVSIPGLYLPTDEDLKVNVYGVNETTYLNEPYMTRTPGPAIWKG